MGLDLLLGLLWAALTAWGAYRGAIPAGAGLLGLVGGYVGGWMAASHASGWAASTLDVPAWLSPAIAGSIGFFVAWLSIGSLAIVARAWDAERAEGGRGPLDRALGGAFGFARGGLLVVLLAIGASWLDAARDLGVAEGFDAMPDAETSRLANASGDLVGAAVERALGDAGPAAEVVGRLASRPGVALESVQTLLEDDRLTGLFGDKLLWTLIQNDSIDYALNRQAVRSIVQDPDLRGRFADLGLVEEGAREDPKAFRDELGQVLAELAPKIEHLHESDEMRALASDPEIIALVEARDTLALIGHPRIRKLVDEVRSAGAPAP